MKHPPIAPNWSERCGSGAPNQLRAMTGHEGRARRRRRARGAGRRAWRQAEGKREAKPMRSAGQEALLDVGVERARGCGRARPRRRRGTAGPRPGTPRPRSPMQNAAPWSLRLRRSRCSKNCAVVLLRRRHHVGLVVQRALAQREPDGEDVLLLAVHPDVPARAPTARRARPRPPRGCSSSCSASQASMSASSSARVSASAIVVGHGIAGQALSCTTRRARREVGVEAPEAGRRGRPGVAAGALGGGLGDARPRGPGRRGALATAAAKSAGSRSSTRKPVTPSSTSVRSPPTAAATTGVPQAAASRATRPNDSERLGTTHTSAAR